MHDSYWITNLLNAQFAGPVDALMNLVGVHPADPAHPINNDFALEVLIAFGLIAFFAIVRMSLSVENPGALQQVAEIIHEQIGGQAEQIVGHGYQRFQAFTTCVFIYVLLMNLTGLIPGIITPTSAPVVPLGIAICTFIYYNFYGVKEQGIVGYIKHHAGPIWWISPLLFPIEIVSNLARVMSLTIRLYANMFASDLVTLVFFSLVPIGVPVLFLGLHAGVSFIQAYVFMLLSMIYLGIATEHEH